MSSSSDDRVYSGKDTESTLNSGEREYSGLHSELHSTRSQSYSGKDSELMPSGGQYSGKDSELRSQAKAVLKKGKDNKFIVAKPLYPQKADSKKSLPKVNNSK